MLHKNKLPAYNNYLPVYDNHKTFYPVDSFSLLNNEIRKYNGLLVIISINERIWDKSFDLHK